jgi:hypothetical protein
VSLRDRADGQFRYCTFTGNRYSGLGCLDAGEGGKVFISRSVFRQNGMRPIYRGPMHIDPLIPTPAHIKGPVVECITSPNATVELFLDRAGEAAKFLRSVPANRQGRFQVSTEDVPEGWVMTATATTSGSTSEFNIVAGTNPGPVLSALLSRTGPLSDEGGPVRLDTLLRRWKRGTHLIFHIENPPSAAVEKYVRFMVQRVPEWTRGSIAAEVRIGRLGRIPTTAVVIPVKYLQPDSTQLMGRGGVTFMKWDANGYFLEPMEILLARGRAAEETCPRVLAHEVGHALGLCHSRIGLLSRMQGSDPPTSAFVNDFSPMMTYYDVLALQVLHDSANERGMTLRDLVERGAVPLNRGLEVAQVDDAAAQPSFSPPAGPPASGQPRRTRR